MNGRVSLLTGATGFIGSQLARAMLNDGWHVHAIVRPNSDMSSLEECRDAITFHVFDGSALSLRAAFDIARPDVVFHLAAWVVSECGLESLDRLIRSNIEFGAQLISAMVDFGVKKLVNTGTFAQFDPSGAYAPASLYAATKEAFETILQYAIDAKGMQVISLYPQHVYGPGDKNANRLMNLLKKTLKEGQVLAMSPGRQLIDFVEVTDVARAYLVAAHRLMGTNLNKHERYSVGSGEQIELRELVSMIEKQVKRELPIQWGGRNYREREVMKPWSGPHLPGWIPNVQLKEGISTIFGDLA
jgi:nucleoside-diphosphate-sugar epimerase